MIGLQGHAPSAKPSIVVLEYVKPLQSSVVSLNNECSPKKVDSEGMYTPGNGQTLFLYCVVSFFSRKELVAIVRDRMLPTFIIYSAENCLNPFYRGIKLESELSGEIRTLEYREAAQLLQLLPRNWEVLDNLHLARIYPDFTTANNMTQEDASGHPKVALS